MRGAVLPLSQYVVMARHLVKHRDNFTRTFYGVHRTLFLLLRRVCGNLFWSTFTLLRNNFKPVSRIPLVI
jgi:hypothetical protein